MTLDKNEGSVEEDATLTLVATTVPEDAEVSWTSSDNTIASVNNGVVTGEGVGTATITATITVDEVDYTATCSVTVTAKPQPSITLDKSEGTVEEDSTLTLVATTIPNDAEVSWDSSDDNTATVEGGVVTGVAAGTATITASITVDGVDYTDTCAITVTAKAENNAEPPTV